MSVATAEKTITKTGKPIPVNRPLTRKKGGEQPVVATAPPIAYDLIQLGLFPLNYLIGLATAAQAGESKWNETGFDKRKLVGTGKAIETLKAEILNEEDIAFNEEDLVRLYDALPAAEAEKDLIGRSWRGRVLRTNGSVLDVVEWLLVRPLKAMGVNWGKRYRSRDMGDPLLLNWNGKFYFPFPAWGNVGMTDIRWRGVPTATMNYDHQPWKDYFKVLVNEGDNVVLLGVWTHKDVAGGWFTLTLEPDVPTP